MGTGPIGSVFEECSVYRETRGTRLVAKPIRGNSFYRTPVGNWAQETCAGCPQQRYATGEQGKAQGRDRLGIVEGSREYRAHCVSIRGKFVLSRNPGSKLEDRHEVGTGPSACCGYCCLIYPTEFSIWGKFFLSSPRG